MSILSSIVAAANSTPAHGVEVGLYGFFFSESSEFPMDDTSDIFEVAKEVVKRYGDRAYGFRRCYYLHGVQHFVDEGWAFLSGKVRTASEVLSGTSPRERILRDNVKINGMRAVIDLLGGRVFPFDPQKDVIIQDLEMSEFEKCKENTNER